ncbi:MAG: large conductance mechanosensitive channel protein MscL [Bacteriovorax sp.]|nr:large conductance mechanosensitive channel protein MscL [Bacteriovorax sp.]
MFKEFKEFAMKGNVVDLAVGIIIGSAFGTIVKSLVDDIVMPPIGYLLGNVDFTNLFIVLKEGRAIPGPYNSLADATKAGAVMIKYGVFANTIVSFMIVAFSVFLLIKQLNRFKKEDVAVPGPTPELKVLTEIRDLLKK